MLPQNWTPAIELSKAEAKIMAKIPKAKLFIWLRKNRPQSVPGYLYPAILPYYSAV